MTICISAIADHRESIVSCVDTKLATEITSAELAVGPKLRSLAGWTFLYSGTVGYAEKFLDTFRGMLEKQPGNAPDHIRRLLEEARAAEIQKFGADRFLSPFGIDMQSFLTCAHDDFSRELKHSILEYSDRYDVEWLVSGWGDDQEKAYVRKEGSEPIAHLLKVNRNGVIPCSHEGFAVSGIGSVAASSILSYFNYETHMPIARAIYCVAAAKFMAERTEGVGKNTIMRVHKIGNGNWDGYFIQPAELAAVREIWEKTGAPRITDEAEDAVIAIVSKHEPKQRVSIEHMGRTLNKFLKGEDVGATPLASQTSEPEP